MSMNKDEQKYIGKSLHMTKEEKYVSFLNNYFVFKKVRHIEQIKDAGFKAVHFSASKFIKNVSHEIPVSMFSDKFLQDEIKTISGKNLIRELVNMVR